MSCVVPISVIIPTWRRLEKLKVCLNVISECDPQPEEVLIHIDAGDCETEKWMWTAKYKNIRWKYSETTQGPGGGRNWLIRNAKNELICGLDDDSWPMEKDFFLRAKDLMEAHPKAGIITLKEIRKGQASKVNTQECKPVASFQSGACLMRKSAFLKTEGYVPLRYAYGMEEADVSLQLINQGWEIIRCDALRIFHDTDLKHQSSREINAAHITNTALLAFLRYPICLWPMGILQTANRIRYAVSQKRFAGIVKGVWDIPWTCWRWRAYRKVVKAETIWKSRRLAKNLKK